MIHSIHWAISLLSAIKILLK